MESRVYFDGAFTNLTKYLNTSSKINSRACRKKRGGAVAFLVWKRWHMWQPCLFIITQRAHMFSCAHLKPYP